MAGYIREIKEVKLLFNPSSLNIHVQILQTDLLQDCALRTIINRSPVR